MSELAKRRAAHDLWVSRSQLWAFGIGVVLVAMLSFTLGVIYGRQSAVSPEISQSKGLTQSADEGDALLQLLARVESSDDLDGGLDRITFPDALAGRELSPGIPQKQKEQSVAVVDVRAGTATIPDLDKDGFHIMLENIESQAQGEALVGKVSALSLGEKLLVNLEGNSEDGYVLRVTGFKTQDETDAAMAGIKDTVLGSEDGGEGNLSVRVGKGK